MKVTWGVFMFTFKPIKLNTFDVIVICIALAYLAQFPILTLFSIPAQNLDALTDSLKDLRGVMLTIVGAYVRDKVGPFFDDKPKASA